MFMAMRESDDVCMSLMDGDGRCLVYIGCGSDCSCGIYEHLRTSPLLSALLVDIQVFPLAFSDNVTNMEDQCHIALSLLHVFDTSHCIQDCN